VLVADPSRYEHRLSNDVFGNIVKIEHVGFRGLIRCDEAEFVSIKRCYMGKRRIIYIYVSYER
jgi:hypothetical protein